MGGGGEGLWKRGSLTKREGRGSAESWSVSKSLCLSLRLWISVWCVCLNNYV